MALEACQRCLHFRLLEIAIYNLMDRDPWFIRFPEEKLAEERGEINPLPEHWFFIIMFL